MSKGKKSGIQLLPNGEFILNLKNDQKEKGRFSMYVLDRFCEEKKVDNLLALFEKLISGMKVGDYADLILMAVQDYYRSNPANCPFDRASMMDALDEIGGLNNNEVVELVKHAVGRVATLKEAEEPAANEKKQETTADDELKKKE